MLDQITPVILTFNEEPNIARTLGQLAWAREVVVIDSLSTDRTVELARQFPNVRVVPHAFETHAAQWTFGLQQVRTPWMLALDADYFVPEAFARELESLAVPAGVRAFRASFRYAVGGKTLRASLYPPRIVLAAVAHLTFVQEGHTQRESVDGEIGALQTPLVHDDRKDFKAFLDRQRRYMRQEAQLLRTRDPRALSVPDRVRKLVVVAPFAVMVHTLFVRGLILDGMAGLRYTWERFLAELILSRELLRRR